MSEYSAAVKDFLAIDDAMGAVLTLTERNDLQQAIRNLSGNFDTAQRNWDEQSELLRSRVIALRQAKEALENALHLLVEADDPLTDRSKEQRRDARIHARAALSLARGAS